MTTPRVTITTATPRDRHTPTIRLVSILTFPGMPIPGMSVDLVMPGTFQPVPGFVHSFDAGLGVVRVSPDFQLVRQCKPSSTLTVPTGHSLATRT